MRLVYPTGTSYSPPSFDIFQQNFVLTFRNNMLPKIFQKIFLTLSIWLKKNKYPKSTALIIFHEEEIEIIFPTKSW